MFCTTECWNCEDKNCENYMSKQELYFENKELKRNCKIGYESLNFYREKYKKYKFVLDEIRKVLNNQMNYREFVDMINAIDEILDKVKDL